MEEQQQAQPAEEEIAAEEEARLPFPTAAIVRIIKKNLKNEHQIKKDVKIAANYLLTDILAEISRTMDQEAYFTLSIEHFNKAARKYKQIELAQKRVVRIKKLLEKQRSELDETITEIELDQTQ